MRRLRFTLATGLLLVAAVASAQTRPAAPPSQNAAIPEVKFEKYTLPNGLDVILHVDRKLPIVHVNEWFHVGSKNEATGRTGFAHLFEHVMFQGSKNAPGEYFSYAERAGANLREGGINGTTSFDRTNYFVTAPAGSLEYLLWLESDRVATLMEAFTEEKLNGQRDVVRNERRQSYENTPYGRAFKTLFEGIFPAGHPYSWMVIGSHEDLQAATVEDVSEFFKNYYTPNNMTLVVAGDFDPAEAKALIEKYWAPIAPGPALQRPGRWIPKLHGEKIVEVADRVPQERTYMAWPGPEYFGADQAELDLAGLILSDGLSSRLNRVLVYDKQMATNVNAGLFAGEIAGIFFVQATARPGASLDEIEKIIDAEIARLAKEGPSAEELDRAKTKWEYEFVSGLERIGGFGGKADLLAQYNTFLGDPSKFDDDVARYRAVSRESLRKAVSQWIDSDNRLISRFRPEQSSRPAEAKIDRAQVPALGQDRRFETPQVATAKLSNGMDIYVVSRPELPKVAVSFATRAGVAADPNEKAGLANMTVVTIDSGTPTRKALEIEDALGNLGTALSGYAGRVSSILSFEVLSRNLPAALEIVSDVVRNPTFPASEVDLQKKRTIDNLTQLANNPNAIAARVRPMLLFGPDHPYGRPSTGLPSTVGTITRDDIAAFHSKYWKPGSSALIFVGDVTLEQATKLAETHFGKWSGGAAPAVTIPPANPADPTKVYIVDRQDAAQTVVSQIMPGPARTSDDYYSWRLVDAVWGGGGFGTRLNLNLREDKGYSYGVFSNSANYTDAGAWWASGGVQTDKTKESLVEFGSELKGIAGTRPITREELDFARESRVRGYAQQFEGVGRIAGQIAELWTLGLPTTELQREVDVTSAATAEQVKAAGARWVKPDATTLLLVGDRSRIESGVRDLRLGEIVILDAEGKPVK